METALEYQARRDAEARARLAEEVAALEGQAKEHLRRWGNSHSGSAKLIKAERKSWDNITRAVCCGAPLGEPEPTGKYRDRHRGVRSLGISKTAPCRAAVECARLADRERTRRGQKA